jgi:phosphatidyl-myo-inositol dimannoside synthase
VNVLFCALDIYSNVGGMQRFNQRVLQSLSELCAQSIDSATALVLWDRPEDGSHAPRNLRFLAVSRSKFGMVRRFVEQLLTHQPDVIFYGHVLLAPLAVLGRLLRPASRHILIVHGFEVWDPPNLLWKLLVKNSAQMIVSVSRFTARKMAAAYGIPEHRFEILPNAVDVCPDRRPQVNNKIGPNGSYNFLTVARLSDCDGYKGHEKVIRAMPAVLADLPEAHYYIIGEGPLRGRLVNLAAQLGVAKHVHLLGHVDDEQLEQLYAHSQVFVMPSKKEGFGIVFLEAWKHFLPVIAGNQDASSEVVEHGLNGLIVDPDDPRSIAQAIVGLLSNPSKMKAMGENGWNTLQRNYTHERFKARFAEVLS